MRKNQSALVAILFLICSVVLNAQTERRNYLSNSNTIEILSGIVMPLESYRPFPDIHERDKWEGLPDNLKNKMVEEGVQYLNYQWKTIPASITLDYVRNGNRSRYQELASEKRNVLTTLLFAELIENKGRFLDDIVNGIWAICEESFWGATAHLSAQSAGFGLPDVAEPIVDLFAAETATLLSYSYYLLGDKLDGVSRLIRPRIKYEIDRRIFQPYLSRDSWWMGFARKTNNWNPWINSNVLMTTLLIQDDKYERTKIIRRILITLDNFINQYPNDGGCDEGPGYWNAAGGRLFICLDYLEKSTNGKINIYEKELIKNIASYIYKMYIGNNYFFNTGDGSAIVNPDPIMIYSFGKKINDPVMMSYGSYLFKEATKNGDRYYLSSSVHFRLSALFTNEEIINYPAAEPFQRDFYMQESEYMGARSYEGSSKGLYIAMQGGNNAESHNHNDVGNFIIYIDGQPAIIDVGVENYTAKTFGPNRYEIWTMQSAYHNLPTINGVMQKDGAEFKSTNVRYDANDQYAQLKMDIAKSYPVEAKVKKWERTLKLNRGKNVELTDSYELKEFIDLPQLNFMTCLEPNITVEGQIDLNPTALFKNKKLSLFYDKKKFSAQLEKIKIDDARLNRVWGNELTRIILISKNNNLKDEIKITFKQ